MKVFWGPSWVHIFRTFLFCSCLCLPTKAGMSTNQTIPQSSSVSLPGIIPVNWPSNIIIIPVDGSRVEAVAEIIRTTIEFGKAYAVRTPYRPAFSGVEFWTIQPDENAPDEIARLMNQLSVDDVSHPSNPAWPFRDSLENLQSCGVCLECNPYIADTVLGTCIA